jgi:hypothetical protein
MPDTPKDYLVASDNADDYAQSRIEALDQQAHEDIDDLITSDAQRDAELWQELEVNPALTIDDYDGADPDDRDLKWTLGVAGLSAAASTQFFLDQREDTIIKPLAYREQVVGTLTLSTAALVTAGKRGVEVAVTAVEPARFAALQAKYIRDLSFLAEMGNVELYNTLLEYKAIRPIEQVIASQTQYVARMTRYRPGTPQFKEAVNALIDTNSTRNLTNQSRRAVEGAYSYREADGDSNTLMVWIGEGGPKTCSYCYDRFGEIQSYAAWESEGLPGSDVCAGGDACRCHLAAA